MLYTDENRREKKPSKLNYTWQKCIVDTYKNQNAPWAQRSETRSQPVIGKCMYVCMQKKKTRAHTLENKLKTDLDTEHEHKGTPSSIVIGDARQKFQAERTRDWILSLILDSKHSQIISVYHQQLSIFCMGAYCAVYSSRSNRIGSGRIGSDAYKA